MEHEGLRLEYKREYSEEIKNTVIAFANTEGGEILIGIDDSGEVYGVEDMDALQLRIVSALRDSIRPDVTMFVHIAPESMEGKEILRISVQRGASCPYYLRGKGIRPAGVFLRKGPANIPATEAAIRHMIQETSNFCYEEERSLSQELSFHAMTEFFEKHGLADSDQSRRTLGLIGPDGTYTNLAQFLSDGCVHTIRAAVFQGSRKTVFRERREFSGSLLTQAEEVIGFIDRFNRTRAEFGGLYRRDTRDYPPEAVREAVLNAIVHRDYAYRSSTLISIFDDRLEIVTLGSLPSGIAYDDLRLGVSVPRNRNLAEVFYRLGLIEAFGTGIPKILECYQDDSIQPRIEVSENAFKVTLPNRNFAREEAALGPSDSYPILREEADIVYHAIEQGCVRRRDLEAAGNFSRSKTTRLLRQLVDAGRIIPQGKGRNTSYRIQKR